MSLRDKNALKLPKLDPESLPDHRANNRRLTIWGNDIPLNERVFAEVRRATNQTIAASTVTAVSFSTTIFSTNNNPSNRDPFKWFNSALSAFDLTCPQGLGGFYKIKGRVEWENPTTTVALRIQKHFSNSGGANFDILDIAIFRNTITTVNMEVQTVEACVDLLPGDFIRMAVYHELVGGADIIGRAPNFVSFYPPHPFLGVYRISE